MRDENGRLHISFKNGAHIAEAVTIDPKERTIRTIGLGNIESREFKY